MKGGELNKKGLSNPMLGYEMVLKRIVNKVVNLSCFSKTRR